MACPRAAAARQGQATEGLGWIQKEDSGALASGGIWRCLLAPHRCCTVVQCAAGRYNCGSSPTSGTSGRAAPPPGSCPAGRAQGRRPEAARIKQRRGPIDERRLATHSSHSQSAGRAAHCAQIIGNTATERDLAASAQRSTPRVPLQRLCLATGAGVAAHTCRTPFSSRASTTEGCGSSRQKLQWGGDLVGV